MKLPAEKCNSNILCIAIHLTLCSVTTAKVSEDDLSSLYGRSDTLFLPWKLQSLWFRAGRHWVCSVSAIWTFRHCRPFFSFFFLLFKSLVCILYLRSNNSMLGETLVCDNKRRDLWNSESDKDRQTLPHWEHLSDPQTKVRSKCIGTHNQGLLSLQ